MNILHFFIPQEHKFYELLIEQSDNSMKGAESFTEFVEKYTKLSGVQKKAHVNKIKRIEHEGDKKIHEIVDKLNTTFITPIDKEDIHNLTILLDDVLDLINATANQFLRYRIKKMNPHIKAMTKIVLQGMKENQKAIKELEKNKYSKDYFKRVHELENQADDIYHEALDELFDNGNEAVEIIKYKDIYQNLEVITDKIEDVAVVIENIVIKHA